MSKFIPSSFCVHGMSDNTFVPSFPPSPSISPQLCDMQIDVGGLQQLQLCLCKIGLFLCMYLFLWSCVFVGFFSDVSSHWVFPLFFLVGVGQHLPKSCHCLCPQLCIVCVVFCIGSNYDLLVWRAQSALHHIGRCMCTAHKLWLVAC